VEAVAKLGDPVPAPCHPGLRLLPGQYGVPLGGIVPLPGPSPVTSIPRVNALEPYLVDRTVVEFPDVIGPLTDPDDPADAFTWWCLPCPATGSRDR
jgi:hypothetical protein